MNQTIEMNETIEPAASVDLCQTRLSPTRRPIRKRVMHLVRRVHLYFGLLLFPWAMLYGVTAFLFNHPTAFPDQPIASFEREDLVGTPMEALPTPNEQAAAVIAALNEKQKPEPPYRLGAGEAAYATRDFIFATVKADARTFSILYDVKGQDGRIRETTVPPAAVKAPFAVGKSSSPRTRGMGMMGMGGATHNHEGSLKLTGSLTDRFKAAAPALLKRAGFPAGAVTVSLAPDLVFPVEAGGKSWNAVYSPLTGIVTGSPADEPKESELSLRLFLLRLHLAHGYPGEMNARWSWAVIVDAMAGVMCFWGLSGLFMWWQIKATRKAGLIVLLLSATAATVIGVSMHDLLS